MSAQAVAGLTLRFRTNGVSSTTADLAKIDGATDSVAASAALMQRAWSGLAVGAAAVSAAAVAVGAALAGSARAALAEERVYGRLGNALSRLGLSYDDNRERISAYIAEQQALTRFGDDQTAESLTQLANITNGIGASIDDLIRWQRLAADVSEATGNDLSAATDLVAKAAAGNARALRQSLPAYREQLDEIDKLTSASERGRAMVALLGEAFGGAASDIAPLDRAVARLSNGFGDVIEGMGSIVTHSEGVSEGVGRVASLFDVVARSLNSQTALGAQWGQALGSAALYVADRMALTADLAVRSLNAITESARIAAGETRENERARSVSAQAIRELSEYQREWTVNAMETRAEIDDFAGSLRAAAEVGAVGADTAQRLLRDLEAGGAQRARALSEGIPALVGELQSAERAFGEAAGAQAEAFAARQAEVASLRDQIASLRDGTLQLPAATEEAASAFVPLAESAGTASAAVSDLGASFSAMLDGLYPAEAGAYRIEAVLADLAQRAADGKAKLNDAIIAAQEAHDAKMFTVYEAERAALQSHADKEAEIMRQREQTIAGGANSLASALIAIEGKTAKDRRQSLARALGGELVTRGGALIAQGVGHAIALNPIGALEIAGGASMVAAGKRLGGVGLSEGGGGSNQSQTEPVTREAVTNNNNTTVIEMIGAGLPRRALERARTDGRVMVAT